MSTATSTSTIRSDTNLENLAPQKKQCHVFPSAPPPASAPPASAPAPVLVSPPTHGFSCKQEQLVFESMIREGSTLEEAMRYIEDLRVNKVSL